MAYGEWDDVTLSAGAADLLRLTHRVGPLSRADVGELAGWARATINTRIDELLKVNLLRDLAPAAGGRGRPVTKFDVNHSAGQLLVADVGASGARFARCDLNAKVLAHTETSLNIADGPERVLKLIADQLSILRSPLTLWGVGVSLPGPIEHATGKVVSPPIMTGWDGIHVPRHLEPVFGAPVLVDKDTNAMAWGESRHLRGVTGDDLLLIKVGTGIGAGIISHGQIMRGAQGAAGDLGHTWAPPENPAGTAPLCRCGKLGCIEAYAGGWAIVRDLAADGEDVKDISDAIRLFLAGNANVIRRIRDSGRVLGQGVAQAVSLLNPSQIIIGGQLAVAGEHLLAGIREHVAAHSLPLATQHLYIRTSSMGGDSGVIGLADALATWVLHTEHLDAALQRMSQADLMTVT